MNVFLIGEPATGKSTIVKEVLKSFKEVPQSFKFKKINGKIYHNSKVVLLGTYGQFAGLRFGGTDRFSMAVQPDAIAFLDIFEKNFPEMSLLLEGDRLANREFIEKFLTLPSRVVMIQASKPTKLSRHFERGDTQTEIWLRGRETKVENLRNAFPVEVLENETPEDISRNAALVLSLLKN